VINTKREAKENKNCKFNVKRDKIANGRLSLPTHKEEEEEIYTSTNAHRRRKRR